MFYSIYVTMRMRSLWKTNSMIPTWCRHSSFSCYNIVLLSYFFSCYLTLQLSELMQPSTSSRAVPSHSKSSLLPDHKSISNSILIKIHLFSAKPSYLIYCCCCCHQVDSIVKHCASYYSQLKLFLPPAIDNCIIRFTYFSVNYHFAIKFFALIS